MEETIRKQTVANPAGKRRDVEHFFCTERKAATRRGVALRAGGGNGRLMYNWGKNGRDKDTTEGRLLAKSHENTRLKGKSREKGGNGSHERSKFPAPGKPRPSSVTKKQADLV